MWPRFVLRVRLSLFGGFAVPTDCLGVVLWHSAAELVHDAEITLSLRVSLFGGFAVPTDCLGVVPWHSAAFGIHDAEVGLRIHVSLFGGSAIPVDRLSIGPRHSLTAVRGSTSLLKTLAIVHRSEERRARKECRS